MMFYDIPKEGVDDPNTIISTSGKCYMESCNGLTFTHLKRHYERRHGNPYARPKGFITEIPPDGNVDVDKLITREGTCKVPECNKVPGTIKKLKKLKRHYLDVHLKATKKCPTCGNNIMKSYFVRHLLTHSGPVKCSACGTRGSSLLAGQDHKKYHHEKEDDARSILLDEDEAKEYEMDKEASRARTAMHQMGLDRVSCLKTKMKQYETDLSTSGHPLHKRASDLRTKVQQYFTLPTDAMMSYHASFASMWDKKNKIPKMVLEVVEKKLRNEFHIAQDFHPDPNIPKEYQDNFKGFGADRGHLSASANFGEEMLAVPTYYLSNAMPMWPNYNQLIRTQLEKFIRDTAKRHSQAIAIHFPTRPHPLGRVLTVGKGVLVPPYLGTVMIVSKDDGDHIYGWEMYNDKTDLLYDWKECICDPFMLFDLGGLQFNFPRSHFAFVSQSIVASEQSFT